MTRVFVVQETLWRNPDSGELEPRVDLGPAREHGELVPLLGSGRATVGSGRELQTLRDGLADYTARDLLLLLGAPEFIAAAGAIAASRTGGVINWLKWDRRARRYYPSGPMKLYEGEPT